MPWRESLQAVTVVSRPRTGNMHAGSTSALCTLPCGRCSSALVLVVLRRPPSADPRPEPQVAAPL